MFNNYNFYCEKCNYGCDKKYTMNRHKNTKKHKLMDNNVNICSCGKRYKHIQSLNRHKLICNNSIDNYNYNYKNENLQKDNFQNLANFYQKIIFHFF